MPFRQDYADFPFSIKDKKVWYFVVDWKNRTKREFVSVQDKKDIVKFLRTIISSHGQNDYVLFGVWTGQYSTDIFEINIEEGYNKLKEHFPEKDL